MLPSKETNHYKNLAGFILLAILIHLASLPLFNRLPKIESPRRLVAVTLTSSNSSTKNFRKRPSKQWRKRKNSAGKRKFFKKKEKKKEKKKFEKPEKMPEGQVVENVPVKETPPPKETKYLSEHDSSVKKETKSRYRSNRYHRHAAVPSTTRDEKQQSAKIAKEIARRKLLALDFSGNEIEDEEQLAEPPALKLEIPNIEKIGGLKLDFSLDGLFNNRKSKDSVVGNSKNLNVNLQEGQDEKMQESSTSRGGKKSIPTLAMLKPSPETISLVSGDPANDYLEDVEESEATLLNSRQFKYASYFNRIKKGISQHWNPIVEYRKRDPSGRIYGRKDRITVLQVVLNDDGSLNDISVKNSSGLAFLDHEAINAFNKAQPFPNPPKSLLGARGQIYFSFMFYFEIY